MVGGKRGGRSTHGVCFGALSWRIEDGRAGAVDLAGLATAIVYRYDDDEPGSPWRLVLHVDERATPTQHRALTAIFLGDLGGDHLSALPWVRKARMVVGVRSTPIEIRHVPPVHELRVGGAAVASASRAVETQEEVSCIVPGYERVGTELYADELELRGDGFDEELRGTCAFATEFEYVS
jgi:hypothetical protein